MRRASTLMALVSLAACDSGDLSQLQTTDGYASDVFVYIAADATGDQIRPYLSSSSADRLGLCVVAAGEACDQARAIPASKVHEKNGRKILSLRDAVPARADRSYVVVDDKGAKVLEFRLNDAAANPIDAGLALIRKETLVEELTYVAADEHNGRLSATPENDKIADWLIERLKGLGFKPVKGEDYRQRFNLAVGPTSGRPTANVVGMLEGSDPVLKNEYIIIGAHMDHAGTLQRGYTCSRGSSAGDEICNGADDNGSGTVAVLNAAKALSSARGRMKRSVIVMWFSGEEEGLLGSKFYVANPLVPLEKTVYMVNLDMVGYMKSFGNALAALGGGSLPAGKKAIEEIAVKYPGNQIKVSAQAGGGSDHAPFFAKGIPGVFYHTGVSNNPNYHRTSDHVDKIDFDGMTMAAKVAFETVYKIANVDAMRSYADPPRTPLITEEELAQSCHHLIDNPFVAEMSSGLDFTDGNDGVLRPGG